MKEEWIKLSSESILKISYDNLYQRILILENNKNISFIKDVTPTEYDFILVKINENKETIEEILNNFLRNKHKYKKNINWINYKRDAFLVPEKLKNDLDEIEIKKINENLLKRKKKSNLLLIIEGAIFGIILFTSLLIVFIK